MTPDRYRRITMVALWLLVFIVVTGAAVRLTGSGLGCSDWPTCENDRLVAPLQLHPMIEFVNRMITGLVSVAVALAVLGSLKRTPRRRDLTLLSLGLVGGVVAQIVLGGIVVLFHLNPVLVQGHFVLSMVLVANALVLHHRAGRPDGRSVPLVTAQVRRLGWALVVLASAVILTGTSVTGAGPHAGDLAAKRLPFSVHAAAQIHGAMLFLFLGAVVLTAALLQREGAPTAVMSAVRTLLFVMVMQAAVGYTQYFTGIPPLLVGLHVFGACLVWMSTLWVLLNLSETRTGPHPSSRAADQGHPVTMSAGLNP